LKVDFQASQEASRKWKVGGATNPQPCNYKRLVCHDGQTDVMLLQFPAGIKAALLVLWDSFLFVSAKQLLCLCQLLFSQKHFSSFLHTRGQ
jgi:hypothetical protein